MLRVFAENEQTHRLEGADGTVIGWVRDSTIALHGLDDERRTVPTTVARSPRPP